MVLYAVKLPQELTKHQGCNDHPPKFLNLGLSHALKRHGFEEMHGGQENEEPKACLSMVSTF